MIFSNFQFSFAHESLNNWDSNAFLFWLERKCWKQEVRSSYIINKRDCLLETLICRVCHIQTWPKWATSIPWFVINLWSLADLRNMDFHNINLSISEHVFNKIEWNFKQEVNSLSFKINPDLDFWKHIATWKWYQWHSSLDKQNRVVTC